MNGGVLLEEEINYRTLRKIQQMEKNSPVLTDLIPNFYNNLLKFLKNLNDRIEKEESSQKLTLLRDEINNISKIVIGIYEFREKKILLAAVTKARGGNPDLKNLEDEEKYLYESVLKNMIDSRKKILENKKEIQKTEQQNKDEVKIEEKVEKPESLQNKNPIARVTQNIPEFIGTDKKRYNLRKDDILTLPNDMAEMLIKRGVVETIEEQLTFLYNLHITIFL